MRYVATKNFYIGETGTSVKKGESLYYDGQTLILQNGRQFEAPLFKAAVIDNWVVQEDKADVVDKVSFRLSVNLSPVEKEKPVENVEISSNNSVWDKNSHWRTKINTLETLDKDQLLEVLKLEKGKIRERVEELLRQKFRE